MQFVTTASVSLDIDYEKRLWLLAWKFPHLKPPIAKDIC